MTDQHPITPPPIVREQWQLESPFKVVSLEREDYMIDRAAQWGGDQELEACLLLVGDGRRENLSQVIALRTARRPKPPSDKELALEALQFVDEKLKGHLPLLNYCNAIHTIHRALEALPND